MNIRYFMDSDGDGHNYLIPVKNRKEWNAWCELSDDNEDSWEAPVFAESIDTCPTFVTFIKPEIE